MDDPEKMYSLIAVDNGSYSKKTNTIASKKVKYKINFSKQLVFSWSPFYFLILARKNEVM